VATAVNGGTSPSYQWKINAGNASNGNNATYSYAPGDGDVVTCEVTSSEACITGNPAQSNPITMVVNANLPAGVTIAASTNPFCPGSAVTFTATPVNGGAVPSYQWMVNTNNVSNANNAVFTYNPVENDQVQCVMTSNLACVSGNPAISLPFVMHASPVPAVGLMACFDVVTTTNAQPFRLKGGLPPGGMWSGPGVDPVAGTFNPSAAGAGNKTITYTCTNAATCSDFKTITIEVQTPTAFICGNKMTDVRNSTQYKTFGLPNGKCWMQENLNIGLTVADFQPQTDNCVVENYVHDPSIPNSAVYQWNELMNHAPVSGSQGLCPPGWHVPTSSEWDELTAFFNGPGMAGSQLKDLVLTGSFHSYQGGIYYLNDLWSFTQGPAAGTMYWTSTTSGTDRAVARGLNEYNMSVSRYEAARGNGFGVRCLKDM
jgi:uncharacterized protein (TIGR02145 family)